MTEQPPDPSSPFIGDDDVRAQLSQASNSYEALPGAVADRLDRALADLPDLDAPDTAPAPSAPAKAPWWRRRLVVAAAAAIVVFGGAGIAAQQLTQPQEQSTAANSDSQAPQDSREHNSQDRDPGINEAPKSESQGPAPTFSGRDYGAGELSEAADVTGVNKKSSLDSSLDDLVQDASQRRACLAAVADSIGGTVSAVDFGSFGGEPAMVVVVSSKDEAVGAVAVGPQCDGGDIDVLKSERL